MFSMMPEFQRADFPHEFFTGFIIGVLLISALFTIPPLLAGYGLLERRPWSRMLSLVAAVLAMLSIPMGTALGIYTFWFMMSEQGKHFSLYGEEHVPLPPPPPQSWR
jgi:zinc transporter ZupT